MNFTKLNKVLKGSDLCMAQRMIMVVLLNHARDQDCAWPSQASIAEQVGLSEDRTRPHIKALCKRGWLQAEKRGHGYHYTLLGPDESSPEPDVSAGFEVTTDPTKCSLKPDESALEPDVSAGLTLQNVAQRTQEPQKNQSTNTQKAAKQPKGEAKAPKPDWRSWNTEQAIAANAVPLPLLAPPEFAGAWTRYRDYRTRRATQERIAREAIAWTVDAAEAALRSCERHAETHGWPAVVARIDDAIAGRWQGLNFQSAPKPHGFRRPQPAAPKANSSDFFADSSLAK